MDAETLMTPPTQTTPAMLDNTLILSTPAVFSVVEAVTLKQDFQQRCQEHADLSVAVLDFSQTTFMDSSGVGALIGCWKIAKSKNIQLVLRNISPQVKMVLTLADLINLFVVEEVAPVAASSEHTATPNTSTEAPVAAEPELTTAIPFVTHPSMQSRTKRAIDIIGALVGLAITGVLYLPIAIAITLDDPGPIFFGQVRCSWMGKRFRMWKFRSMVADAEAKKHLVQNQASGAIFKNANDPRITRVGRFLRKTSLDELPQFWNVLKGEMSLVGTRPPTPDEVERYEIPQWQRLDIKPGMTGEWQVNGRSSVKDFEDVVKLDLKYQENWSLMYDLQLIVKTILVLFNKRSGAM